MSSMVSFGATFWRENTAGGAVYTAVSEVMAVGWSGVQRGAGNATNLADTSVQSVGGLPDLGEITATLKLLPAVTAQDDLRGDASAAPGSAERTYVIGYPADDASGAAQYLSFTGPATGWRESGLEAGNDDAVTVEFTVKVNALSKSATAPATS